MFIGCAGWPDCDVTYPLPKGKIEALEEKCPTCGMPQIKVTAFRSEPRVLCIDPECETNKEPDLVVGTCPTCAEQGKEAKLIAHKNPRTLKRFIRCENYDERQMGYPLPQYGALTATEEVCEECGAPMVIVTTARGPWKLCPNFSCPSKRRRRRAETSAEGEQGRRQEIHGEEIEHEEDHEKQLPRSREQQKRAKTRTGHDRLSETEIHLNARGALRSSRAFYFCGWYFVHF